MRVWIPKDNDIYKALEELTTKDTILIKGDTAKKIGHKKQFKNMRNNNQLYIGPDRTKKVSILHIKKTIKKKGKGFLL